MAQFDKNIIRVGDFLKKDGKFLSFENFCNKFKLKIPFTVNFGLINAIPISWKFVIKMSPSRFAESEKTNKLLRYDFSHETIHKMWVKNDIAITMFQYKIIHSILATKVSLSRAKICNNNECPQCLTDIHSIDHTVLHCSSARAFWKAFQSWWANKTKQSLTLSNSMILYGVFDNIEHRYALNYAILISEILIILQLPTRRKTLFWQFSHIYAKN